MKCLIEFLLLLTEEGKERGGKEGKPHKFHFPQTKKEKWRRRKPVQRSGKEGEEKGLSVLTGGTEEEEKERRVLIGNLTPSSSSSCPTPTKSTSCPRAGKKIYPALFLFFILLSPPPCPKVQARRFFKKI